MDFSTWILALLLSLVKPGPAVSLLTGAENETEVARRERFAAISRDLSEVVQSEAPIFPGPQGRARTAALLLGIAAYESAFLLEVDRGIDREERAKRGQEDHGRSWCLLQINLGQGRVLVGSDEMRSWRGQDLVADRKKCFRVGLEMARRSVASCARVFGDQRLWLNQYASGECKPDVSKCAGDATCEGKAQRTIAEASLTSRNRMDADIRGYDRFRKTAPKMAR